MPSLGNDLATLRKKKDFSIEDVQKSTRISKHILHSIEDDSIFENMPNNVIYTRSYVRSYARSIGVEEAKIIEALDKVEQGNYSGGLLTDAEQGKKTGADTPENAEDSNEDEVNEEKESAGKNESHKSREPITVSSDTNQTGFDTSDWVRVGQQTSTGSSSSGRTKLVIILLLIAIIAAGFIIYTYYYAGEDRGSSDPQSHKVQQPATPSDSLRNVLLNSDSQPASISNALIKTDGSLADTLVIGIYAANGKLEPVRVYTDILEQQNPYWVQKGDTIRFNFVNTVRVRAVNQYDRLQLLFNGHLIPNYYEQYYNDKSNMVELDRTVFKNHSEWQRPAE